VSPVEEVVNLCSKEKLVPLIYLQHLRHGEIDASNTVGTKRIASDRPVGPVFGEKTLGINSGVEAQLDASVTFSSDGQASSAIEPVGQVPIAVDVEGTVYGKGLAC